MTLFPEEIRRRLPSIDSQQSIPDPIALLKFYDTQGDWSWYVVAFDGHNTFFGLVLGCERELGFFFLTDFESTNKAAGFQRIRLDSSFEPKALSTIQH